MCQAEFTQIVVTNSSDDDATLTLSATPKVQIHSVDATEVTLELASIAKVSFLWEVGIDE